jgi:hypothetical protein
MATGVTMVPGYGGTFLVESKDGRWRAVVQLASRADDRLRVGAVELRSLGRRRLDVGAWRSFPLAMVESVANLPAYRETVLAHLRDDDPDRHGKPVEDWTPGRKSRKPVLPGRPETGRYPDRFYERLADLYRHHVERGDPPAQRIADDEGVPVTTVHRWIRQSRRRGFLRPAGARGRAG